MSAPLNVSKPVYGKGEQVEQANQVTKGLLKQKAAAPPVAGPAAPPAAPSPTNEGPRFAGPQNLMQVPNAPPTYQAPFKTETEKNAEVAAMFDILSEKSTTWQTIIASLRGEG